ncbi:translation initiation factor IF-2-like isoform X3 [Cygnus olor]|uniref:translation initiation factor IF-2-like isoform X3 n=1 Tax=Cygnus olor TaxID=8869 RepID=UPI001ADE49EC|nr:translation initiation factor IF-2-like isoform X3 [Cygnus olor]
MPLPHCGCPYPGQDSPPQQTRVKEKKREGKGREGKEEEGPPPPPRNQLGARNPTGTSWGAPFASGPAYKPRCRRRCSRVSLLAASYAPLYVTASRGKWRPLSPPSPCTGLTRPAWQGQGYQGEAKQPPFCLWAAARSAPAEPSVSILQTGSRLGAAEGAERGIAKTPSSAASPPPTSAPASSSRPACRSAVPILGGSQPEGALWPGLLARVLPVVARNGGRRLEIQMEGPLFVSVRTGALSRAGGSRVIFCRRDLQDRLSSPRVVAQLHISSTVQLQTPTQRPELPHSPAPASTQWW